MRSPRNWLVALAAAATFATTYALTGRTDEVSPQRATPVAAAKAPVDKPAALPPVEGKPGARPTAERKPAKRRRHARTRPARTPTPPSLHEPRGRQRVVRAPRAPVRPVCVPPGFPQPDGEPRIPTCTRSRTAAAPAEPAQQPQPPTGHDG